MAPLLPARPRSGVEIHGAESQLSAIRYCLAAAQGTARLVRKQGSVDSGEVLADSDSGLN
jgi:hypothetical protein